MVIPFSDLTRVYGVCSWGGEFRPRGYIKTTVKPTQTQRSSNGLAPTAAAGRAQRSGTCVAGAFCFRRRHCCSDFNGTECWSGSKFHHCRFASSVLLLCVYMTRVISRTKHHTVQLFRRRAAQSFVSFNQLLSPLVLYVAYLATTFSFHVFLTLISVAESWTIGAVSLMWMYRSPVQRYNLDLDDITLP